MLISANTMRILLGLCLLGMSLVAVFYLRQRKMNPWQYLKWGLLAVLLPILGPFLVIVMAPGKPGGQVKSQRRRRRNNRHLLNLLIG